MPPQIVIAVSLMMSVTVSMVSSACAEDFITKRQLRKRIPTRVSPQSMSVFTRACLLVRDDARTELNLAEEQGKQVDSLLADWCEQVSILYGASLERLPGEAGLSDPSVRRLINETSVRETEKTLEGLREILTAEQHARLEQLVLQLEGISAIASRELSVKLNLNQAQLTQIITIRRSFRSAPGNKDERTLHEQILAVLTPEQREQWKALTGKPFFPPGSRRSGIKTISVQLSSVRSPLSLVRYEPVRTALQLTEEQQRQIAVPVVTWLDARLAWDESLVAGADEKQLDLIAGKIQTAVDEVTEVLDAVLTEAQMDRLGQITLQQAGIYAFKNAKVLQELDLNQEQREKVDALIEALSRSNETIGQDAMQQRCREVLKLLTDEQRQKWRSMTGEPVDFTADE